MNSVEQDVSGFEGNCRHLVFQKSIWPNSVECVTYVSEEEGLREYEVLRSRDIVVVFIRPMVALMGVAYTTAISNDWND
jgi:hypothetical protein